MRYLAILSVTEEDGTPDEPWERTSPEEVILCKDSKEVAAAIQSARRRAASYGDTDWCIFEVMGEKTERRAVVFKMNGDVVDDCEIS